MNSKIIYLPAEDGRLPSRSVNSITVLYLLYVDFLSLFCLFRNFAPIATNVGG